MSASDKYQLNEWTSILSNIEELEKRGVKYPDNVVILSKKYHIRIKLCTCTFEDRARTDCSLDANGMCKNCGNKGVKGI